MSDTLFFFGDGQLPGNGLRVGHFLHVALNGGVWRHHGDLPRAFETCTVIERELLPWVPFADGDPAQQGCGLHVGEGQGMGVARYRRFAGYSVLGMWDRTGDRRGNCMALFFTRQVMGAAELLARVQREYPDLWARITKGGTVRMQVMGDPDPDPVARVPVATLTAETERVGISIEEVMPGLWERLYGSNLAIDEDKVADVLRVSPPCRMTSR